MMTHVTSMQTVQTEVVHSFVNVLLDIKEMVKTVQVKFGYFFPNMFRDKLFALIFGEFNSVIDLLKIFSV